MLTTEELHYQFALIDWSWSLQKYMNPEMTVALPTLAL
jgi:hypothetical protein